jgi:hypothetical protein
MNTVPVSIAFRIKLGEDLEHFSDFYQTSCVPATCWSMTCQASLLGSLWRVLRKFLKWFWFLIFTRLILAAYLNFSPLPSLIHQWLGKQPHHSDYQLWPHFSYLRRTRSESLPRASCQESRSRCRYSLNWSGMSLEWRLYLSGRYFVLFLRAQAQALCLKMKTLCSSHFVSQD